MKVDLGRSRSVSSHVYQDFTNCHLPPDLAGSLNTLPVPISRKDCPFKARFVFAYGVDNSDKPSYLLWPIRGGNGQFLLVDPWSGNYFDLEAAKFMEPIGIEHFFDAFSLDRKRPLKVDAAAALRIPVNEVSDSLVVKQDRANRFELTPVWAPVEPPTKRAKTAEVRLSSASDVPMPPRSVAKMILRMCLIWRSLTKRILTSVLSRMEWTRKLWNGMALVTQMMRYLELTSPAGWKHFTP